MVKYGGKPAGMSGSGSCPGTLPSVHLLQARTFSRPGDRTGKGTAPIIARGTDPSRIPSRIR